jgi:hypothetical protein
MLIDLILSLIIIIKMYVNIYISYELAHETSLILTFQLFGLPPYPKCCLIHLWRIS